MIAWFSRVFPDAVYVEPGNCHLPVRMTLERLGLATPSRGSLQMSLQRLGLVATPRAGLRIIGVVREPFEMLVSLFEYWRRFEFDEEPQDTLIHIARTGTFRDFLALAVGEGLLANYHIFFDVGGPAWPTTRLLDFHSLQPALAAVCNEFGIKAPETLERLNAAPQQVCDLTRYRDEAGSLVAAVHRHFAWYYRKGVRLRISPGSRASRRAA